MENLEALMTGGVASTIGLILLLLSKRVVSALVASNVVFWEKMGWRKKPYTKFEQVLAQAITLGVGATFFLGGLAKIISYFVSR